MKPLLDATLAQSLAAVPAGPAGERASRSGKKSRRASSPGGPTTARPRRCPTCRARPPGSGGRPRRITPWPGGRSGARSGRSPSRRPPPYVPPPPPALNSPAYTAALTRWNPSGPRTALPGRPIRRRSASSGRTTARPRARRPCITTRSRPTSRSSSTTTLSAERPDVRPGQRGDGRRRDRRLGHQIHLQLLAAGHGDPLRRHRRQPRRCRAGRPGMDAAGHPESPRRRRLHARPSRATSPGTRPSAAPCFTVLADLLRHRPDELHDRLRRFCRASPGRTPASPRPRWRTPGAGSISASTSGSTRRPASRWGIPWATTCTGRSWARPATATTDEAIRDRASYRVGGRRRAHPEGPPPDHSEEEADRRPDGPAHLAKVRLGVGEDDHAIAGHLAQARRQVARRDRARSADRPGFRRDVAPEIAGIISSLPDVCTIGWHFSGRPRAASPRLRNPGEEI